MASEKITAMIDEIKARSVLELKELVDEVCETFGVSAVAAAAPAAGGAAEAVAEKTEFDVVMTSFGAEKIKVIKEIRGITGLGLAVGEKLHKLLERGLAQGREKQAGRRNVTGDKGLAVGSLLRQRGQAAVIVCRLIKNAVLF